ncbi:MAG: threonylcarbamoyl-AMP synthase [Spirochaetaceae bacterium]|nr:MAG: threonylcarbamoyl-AMP synthase [Spirochaetaceae bacterium]
MSTSRSDTTIPTEQLTPDRYRRAAELLAAGELVVIPTETVYGLAASALDRGAVGAIFDAKERPRDNPLIVHLGDADAARDVVPRQMGLTRAIISAFAPGPITVILPAPPWAVPEVRGGLPTIALRVPSLELARHVIIAAGVPLAAPSANRSGRPSPTTAAMAVEEMGGRVAAVLDGGPCTVGIESTIVDATNDREAVILRPGRITAREISHRLGCPARHRERGDSPSPGTHYRHYTPRVPVVLVQSGDMEEAVAEAEGVFGCRPGTDGPGGIALFTVEQFRTLEGYAEGLYQAFWNAERQERLLILAEMPPGEESEGLADRLLRASVGTFEPGMLTDLR